MACGDLNHKSESLRVELVNWGNLGLFESGVDMCMKCITDGADNALFLHPHHPNVLSRYESRTISKKGRKKKQWS